MMATSPRKAQRLAAQNPCRNTPNWRDGARETEASAERSLPRPPGAPAAELPFDTNGRLSASDWNLLFDAVQCRLLAAARSPATAAVVVPECVDALERLRGMLALASARGR